MLDTSGGLVPDAASTTFWQGTPSSKIAARFLGHPAADSLRVFATHDWSFLNPDLYVVASDPNADGVADVFVQGSDETK